MTTTFLYGTEMPLDSQGSEYTILTHDGVGEEGRPASICGSLREAWARYFMALNRLIEQERATLIEWRVPPVAEKSADETGWKVYSRLSIIRRSR